MACQSVTHRKSAIDKICQACGTPFKVRKDHVSQKCCSVKCAGAIRNKRIEKTCQHCESPYKPKRGREITSKFCGKQCREAAQYSDPQAKEKRCVRCLEVQPIASFYRSVMRRDGKASECGRCTVAYWKRWRMNNRAKVRTQRKRQRATIRRRVIEGYGGKCVCCGESEPKFLAVDHIFNDGNKHRAEVGSAHAVYAWLLKNGCPTDRFQLLCYNCNFAKSCYGLCPHQGSIPHVAPMSRSLAAAIVQESEVIAIRHRYKKGIPGLVSLMAREHKVAPSTIYAIVTGRTWKHLLV